MSEGFKRPVYWSKYKVIPDKNGTGTNNRQKSIRELLDSSYEGIKRLFVFSYDVTDKYGATVDSHQKYLLPRVNNENYHIEIYGRNLYEQPVNDLIRQYDEVRKQSTGQDDDYVTGCLLHFLI